MIMDESLEKILARFTPQPGASKDLLRTLEKTLQIELPDDYKHFLEKVNGGEGFIARHYLILWKAEEIMKYNVSYQAPDFAPSLLLFGSDGGGDAFAFDTRVIPYSVVEVPFIGMSDDDSFFIAENFTIFLKRMLEVDGSLFPYE
jgi:hypothetical protein